MVSVDEFSYGLLNPALAYTMSVFGCFLAILLATKARRRDGQRRVRLLIYATVALGGIGMWQPQVIEMLGFSIGDAPVRFDPRALGLSLVVCLIDIGTGLFLAGYGRITWRRLIPAATIVGLGSATAHYAALTAIRVGATVSYNLPLFAISIVICTMVASTVLWCTIALRGLWSTVGAAFVMGLAICGMHYAGLSAVTVELGPSDGDVTGLTATLMLAPVVLGGTTVMAMLAYFTIGSATLRDLRGIFGPNRHTEAIEPWLITEVTTRVATPPNDDRPTVPTIPAPALPALPIYPPRRGVLFGNAGRREVRIADLAALRAGHRPDPDAGGARRDHASTSAATGGRLTMRRVPVDARRNERND